MLLYCFDLITKCFQLVWLSDWVAASKMPEVAFAKRLHSSDVGAWRNVMASRFGFVREVDEEDQGLANSTILRAVSSDIAL
jgi:hypothetical protein